MTLVIEYRFILCLLAFWQTDANVNIFHSGTETTKSNFECGTKLVLTCQIDGFSSIMTWENDSSNTPIAQCTGSSCLLDQTVAGRYNISADSSAGIFNLTIFQVTFENNNATYICAYGSEIDSFPVIVKDYEPTLNESIPGIIDVSSGCIDNNTEVKFKWEKSNKANLNREIDYQEFKPTNSTNFFNMCLGDTFCEPSQFVKKSYSISIEPGGKDDFRIRAMLTYGGSVVKYAYTNGRYKVKDGGSNCSIKCDTVCYLLIAIGACFFIAVIDGFLLLYVMKILCPAKKDPSKEDKVRMLYIEILLHTVSAILWTVIVILFFLALCHYCSCDDSSCNCCDIVLILRYVLGIIFGIPLILWLILLCVLCEQNGIGDDEGHIHCKIIPMKVIIAFSTIPLVGPFPVCGWLIRIFNCENSGTQKNIHAYLDKTQSSKRKEDQVSASGITVEPNGTYTVTVDHTESSTSDATSTGKRKASIRTESGKKKKKQRRKKNSILSNSASMQLTQNDITEITSSQKHISEQEKKSKKGADEIKCAKTNKVSTEPHIVNKHVSETGSDNKLGSSNDDKLPNSSKSDNTSHERNETRKENSEKEPSKNTKPVNAKTQNGSETITRTISATFNDENDVTTNVSINSETKSVLKSELQGEKEYKQK